MFLTPDFFLLYVNNVLNSSEKFGFLVLISLNKNKKKLLSDVLEINKLCYSIKNNIFH